ncbi:MAG: O-antigen ligase family protein [Clostridia bacterium]|nr:O-antigen ligase family protein [Clostridia bacterium]
MKTVIRKYGIEIARDFLCVAVFLIAVLTGGKTAGIAPFAIAMLLLISAGLVLLRDTKYLTLPFLLLCLLFIFCYDSFSVFIRYVWLMPIPIAALIWHVIRLKPRLFTGPTLFPLIAVALATVLGGIGMISATDYFRPAALGFMAGLGPVLVICYLLLKNTVRDASARDMLAEDLLRWGLTASAIVFFYNLPLLLKNGISMFQGAQWGNNIGTMLMMALPAALAVKNRRLYHYGLAFIMLVAAVLSGSRGAQLFTPIEFLLCCFWGWRTEKDYLRRLWSRTFFLLSLMTMGYLIFFVSRNLYALGFLDPTEARWSLLERGFADFRQNPVFGSGLGYRGNADLYSGKEGTINWYHSSVAQIVGGLGAVGILAWCWQSCMRMRVSLLAWRDRSFGFALCYLGLFLMSLVNPGEFCPVPYAFLAVYFFVAIESALTEMGNLPSKSRLPLRFAAWLKSRKNTKKPIESQYDQSAFL